MKKFPFFKLSCFKKHPFYVFVISFLLSVIFTSYFYFFNENELLINYKNPFKSKFVKPLKIIWIDPKGNEISPEKGAITITFNKDIMPFGMGGSEKKENTNNKIIKDIHANTINNKNYNEIAKNFITFSPNINCDFRWISASKVQCRIKGKLTYATKYEINIKKGLEALDGAWLKKDYVESFSTEKVKINYAYKEGGFLLKPKFKIDYNSFIDLTTLNVTFRYNDKNGKVIKILSHIQCGGKERYSYNEYKVCYDSKNNDANNYNALECLKNLENYSCFLEPNNYLPYDKEIKIYQEKGLKKYPHDDKYNLISDELEIESFKIDDIYVRVDRGNETSANSKEFVVMVKKYIKDFKINYVSDKKIYKTNVTKITDFEKAGLDPSEYYLKDYDFYNITSKESLPFDKKIILKIRNIKLKDNLTLPDYEISTFNTYPKYFKLEGMDCNSETVFIKNNHHSLYEKCHPENIYLKFNVEKDYNTPLVIKYIDEKNNVKSITVKNSYGNNYYNAVPFIGANKFKIIKIKARDRFGRALNQKINLTFRVDNYSPYCELFNNYNAVLEKDEDSDIPMLLTNYPKLKYNYVKITNDEREVIKNKSVNVPYIKNYKNMHLPLGVRSLLNGKSGIIRGNVSCNTMDRENKATFSAQVTPFSIYYKFGITNSLLWVTSLKDGTPIKNAKVSILLDSSKKGILKNYKTLQTAKTNEDGIAIFKGMNELDSKFEAHDGDDCSYLKKKLLIKVSKGEDLGVLPLTSDFTNDSGYGHHNFTSSLKFWGTTTQGVFKRGEEIPFKIIVRDENDDFLKVPDLDNVYKVMLLDPKGDVIQEIKDVKLTEFGTYNNKFMLSKNSLTGNYKIELSNGSLDIPSVKDITFLVADFVPASFKGKLTLDKKKYLAGEFANVDISASLYSGGPLANGKVSIDASIYPKTIKPKDKKYLTYNFNNSYASDECFLWDSYESHNARCEQNNNEYYNKTLFSKYGEQLDINGNKKFTFPIMFSDKDSRIPYGSVVVTTNIQDERGKSVSFETSAEYADYNRFLGMKQTEDWIIYKNDTYKAEFVVIDENGEIVNDADIFVTIYKKIYKSIKEKNVYGTYDVKGYYRYDAEKRYNLKFNGQKVSLEFKPKSGENASYIVLAKVKDLRGNEFSIAKDFYYADYIPSDDNDNDSDFKIKVLKDTYKVGDEAKIKIKNPHPNSYVLITKERFGIIEHFVKLLKTSNEIVSIPVNENDMPGVKITASLMKKRNKSIEPEEVDDDYWLRIGRYDEEGKPQIFTSSSKFLVTGDEKELNINVNVDKSKYSPRSEVKVNLNVKNKNNQGVVSEVSLICLDESVYDLIKEGFKYFNPYYYFKGVLSDNDYVINYSLIERLLGRVKFTKGLNPAGDGNEESNARKDFRYVAYYNPSIITDNEGNASVSFKLPDNLTSFKVIAIAVNKQDRMGANFSRFTVSKPTEIRALLPNKVRIGDKFDARFSILNKEDSKKDYELFYSVKYGKSGKKQKYSKNVSINSFERYILSIPVEVKVKDTIYFNVFAKEVNNSKNKDGLISKVSVLRLRDKESLSFFDKIKVNNENKTKELKVKFPDGISKGELKIVVSTVVLNSLENIFKYMRDYPHPCWEQKLSRALVSAYYEVFKDYIPNTFVWKDGGKVFTNKMLLKAKDYQAPLGGMAFFVADNGNISTYLSAFTLFGFNALKDLGYEIPKHVESELVRYLQNLIKKDSDLSSRMMTVSELSKNKDFEKSEVLRLYDNKDKMNLFTKSRLLMALSNLIKNKNDVEKEAATIFREIMNYADETSKKFSFKDLEGGYSWYDLASNTKTNCSILSAFVNYSDVLKDIKGEEASNEKEYLDGVISKLFNLVLSSRQKDGSYYNTQENIFCLKAISDYMNYFEEKEPSVEFKATLLDKEVKTLKLAKNSKEEEVFKLTKSDSNKEGNFKVDVSGKGSVYYSANLSYYSSLPLKETNAGIGVLREYSVKRGERYEVLKEGDVLKVGDRVRVDLFINLPRESSYVVINDPLPGALEPVNSDLAGSLKDAMENGELDKLYSGDSYYYKKEHFKSYGFYFKELLHDKAKFYSEYLGAGDYHVSYLAEVIAKGTFTAGATYAEEMYAPDIFGRGKEWKMEVK